MGSVLKTTIVVSSAIVVVVIVPRVIPTPYSIAVAPPLFGHSVPSVGSKEEAGGSQTMRARVAHPMWVYVGQWEPKQARSRCPTLAGPTPLEAGEAAGSAAPFGRARRGGGWQLSSPEAAGLQTGTSLVAHPQSRPGQGCVCSGGEGGARLGWDGRPQCH